VTSNLSATLLWILFFVLNRTTVIGRKHVSHLHNTLLLSNHQSMIDSFLVGGAAYLPWSWIKPSLIPWNPAAIENFYKSKFLAWLAYNWHCIPIQEGRRDPRVLRHMVDILPTGVLTLFPEGTRTRTGAIGKGRPGAGLVALSTGARVIPVAIEGMQDLLPIGRWVPRVFKRIYVSYGPPIEYDDLMSDEPSRDAARELVNRVMHSMRQQHAELRKLAGKPPLPGAE
jgi:1-acyl-sn-glycerol-3-phosphate acyltransferase